MSAKVSQELGGAAAMNVSTQGELIIAKFIDTLTIRAKDVKRVRRRPKTVHWLVRST
jgi:hypothetical protein